MYRWHPPALLVEICPPFRINFAVRPDASNEILPMEWPRKRSSSSCTSTARSVGAEVTSPWFYLQFGLILTAAGIA